MANHYMRKRTSNGVNSDVHYNVSNRALMSLMKMNMNFVVSVIMVEFRLIVVNG